MILLTFVDSAPRDIKLFKATSNRWAARKGGSFVARDALSFEQQQILAAVPRWKKEWVRPANLLPGQNPDYKILKWVIDTSADKSSGTAEEMEAAVAQVTSGNIPNVDGTISSSTSSSVTGGSTAQSNMKGSGQPPKEVRAAPVAQVSTAALATASNPLQIVMQPGSAQDALEVQTVADSVKPLQNVPEDGLMGGDDMVEQKERSLVE